MRRTDILKAVTKNVIGSVKDVNIGIMRYHNNEGGPVIHAVKDLDANRDAVNAIIDGLPASGYTPLSETMYEAALYYSGLPQQYGGLLWTDPDAWLTTLPPVYKQPAEYACAKNFIVLITDGEPTMDRDAYYRVGTLPDFSSVMGRTGCTGTDYDGACLEDITEYLGKADINPDRGGHPVGDHLRDRLHR